MKNKSSIVIFRLSDLETRYRVQLSDFVNIWKE